MGTGYKRNDTADNIADGNIINASDLDGEFDALQSAFDNSTGHNHDGSAENGAPIEKVGPAQDVVVTTTTMRPKSDNTVDLGTSLLEYKDLFLDGTAHIDTLDVDENASITGTFSVTSTSTFSDDVTFTGTNYNVVWDKTDNALEFADNAKAIFGAGSDLQIYHSGGGSFIDEVGTGNLLLKTNGSKISFQNDNSGSPYDMLKALTSGAVQLNYLSDLKLATTSTGISVTDDIDVANNIILSSDSANISFGADSEIYIKHNHNIGLILENTVTTDNASFVLNLLSNEDTITADEQIGRINFSTNSTAGGVAAGTQASISVDATGTYSNTVAGSRMEFHTTDTAGTNTRAMYIDDDQSIHFTGPSANVKLDATNDTLDFPDNFKIMVGNGDDLQIYHDGSDSYIDDAGAGTLKIRSNGTGIDLESSTGESLAQFVTNGAAKLYYNNAERLATTNAGLTFTGNTFNFNGTNSDTTLTLQSTNADGNDGPILTLLRNSASPAADDDIGRIDFNGKDSGGNELVYSRIESYIEDPTAAAQYGRTRMLIKSNASLLNFMDLDASQGGASGRIGFNIGQQDIDFVVRSTGNSSLFTVDASTNNIGIGTNDPATVLHINNASAVLRIEDSNNGVGGTSYTPHIEFFAAGDQVGTIGFNQNQHLTIQADNHNDSDIRFVTGGLTRATIDGVYGYLGIGNTAPNQLIEAETDGSADTYDPDASLGGEANVRVVNNSNTTGGFAALKLHSRNANGTVGQWNIASISTSTNYDNALVFHTRTGSSTYKERLRINTSGHVGIGTNNPIGNLSVHGDTPYIDIQDTRSQTWSQGDIFSGIRFRTSDPDGGNVGATHAYIRALHTRDGTNHSNADAGLVFGTSNGSSPSAVARMTINQEGNVGIGTTDPSRALHITHPAPYIRMERDDASVLVGNALGIVEAYGSEGTTNVMLAAMRFDASETHTATAKGTRINFHTTNNGSTTEANYVSIEPNGVLKANNGIEVNANGLYSRGNYMWIGIDDDNSSSSVHQINFTRNGRSIATADAGLNANDWFVFDNYYAGRRPASTSTSANWTYNTGENQIIVSSATNGDTSEGDSYTYLMSRTVADSSNVFYAATDGNAKVRIQANGQAYTDGAWNNSAADYAEMFEWSDGNTTNEDRVGLTVVLDGNKIRKATSSDAASSILGVVSAVPSVVGDTAWNSWHGRILRDDFGRPLMEDVQMWSWGDDQRCVVGREEGTEIPDDAVQITVQQPRINPDWDETQEYTSREERQEWDAIGLVGKLRVKVGQPIGDRWIKMRTIKSDDDGNPLIEEYLVR